MYQVIIYKGSNWKKDEKKYEDYKKVFSSELLSREEATELFVKTRNICCTSKDIYIQQVELQDNNIKIIDEHMTNPDGKDLLYMQSTVKEDIEEYENQKMVVTIFDYRVSEYIVYKLPIEKIDHLCSVLDLPCEDIKINDDEIEICVNS